MRGRAPFRGIVWRRSDFRESSRLVTLLTAEFGRLTTLGKGAHRPGSQCLGKIDFLNLLDVKASPGSLPVLHRVRLIREHRRLREPVRYTAASYLTEVFDSAFLPGRSDPGLFELLSGGLMLIDRCPQAVIPQVLAGIELRYLAELGLLPSLSRCRRCGAEADRMPLFPDREYPGLLCREHARPGIEPTPHAARRWLEELGRSPGRRWPDLPAPPPGARRLLGRWIAAAIERRPRLRAAAFRS